ncbi:SAM-dependent methyltransferase, partial [Planctomycetaceae bacterium]|nr:SAM-dependent methyltransferase [Planctomycetaceae bacterium]
MSFISLGINWMERGLIPDWILRPAIRRLLTQRLNGVTADNCELQQQQFEHFLEMTRSGPVAEVPEVANEQHYEVPTEFF